MGGHGVSQLAGIRDGGNTFDKIFGNVLVYFGILVEAVINGPRECFTLRIR